MYQSLKPFQMTGPSFDSISRHAEKAPHVESYSPPDPHSYTQPAETAQPIVSASPANAEQPPECRGADDPRALSAEYRKLFQRQQIGRGQPQLAELPQIGADHAE